LDVMWILAQPATTMNQNINKKYLNFISTLLK